MTSLTDRPYRLNAETGRMVSQELFGIAAYAGTVEDGVFTGHHQGCLMVEDDQDRWLAGEDVPRGSFKLRPKADNDAGP